MIPNLTTLLKSIAGKVVLGLSVVTMGVGAAAAAGAELPVLTAAPAGESSDDESSDDESSDDESSDDESSDDESSDDESSDDESSDDESSDDESSERVAVADVDEDEEESGEDDGERPDNHGAVVSEFTQGTDLTGCEKGQATAAVARRDVDPTELSDVELTAALAPYIAKCDRGDDLDPNGDDGDEWKDARDEAKADRDEAKADRTAERDEAKADRKAERDEAKADRKASSSNGKAKGKNKNG